MTINTYFGYNENSMSETYKNFKLRLYQMRDVENMLSDDSQFDLIQYYVAEVLKIKPLAKRIGREQDIEGKITQVEDWERNHNVTGARHERLSKSAESPRFWNTVVKFTVPAIGVFSATDIYRTLSRSDISDANLIPLLIGYLGIPSLLVAGGIVKGYLNHRKNRNKNI